MPLHSFTRQVDAIERGIKSLVGALDQLGNVQFQRIGIRQFFAIEISKLKQKQIVERILSRLMHVDSFVEATGMTTKDLAVTLDLEDKLDLRKGGKLVAGAMSAKEWKNFVPYQENGVNSAHLPEGRIGEILKQLPADFLFLDIDKSLRSTPQSENLLVEDVLAFAKKVAVDQKLIAKKAIEELNQ